MAAVLTPKNKEKLRESGRKDTYVRDMLPCKQHSNEKEMLGSSVVPTHVGRHATWIRLIRFTCLAMSGM